jgi:hypothetical protein
MSNLADTLSRAAHGYTGARATDMLYPGIDGDLAAHQWNPRPDRELDGTLPPIPITELGEKRGYRRGWHRGQQQITLWFTGPDCLAYAQADGHGRLADVDQVRALVTSPPLSANGQPHGAARPKAGEPFSATYVRVVDHLRATWGGPIETHSCDEHGIRRPDGTGTSAVWGRPSNPDFRVYVWGIGHQPAHVRYWAGPVADMEHLIRITGTR